MKSKGKSIKVIPHCYQKKNKSNSLSTLLQTVSYKKRINDLARNNKCLARELAYAQRKVADQTKMIQKNSCDKNQVLFAKLKVNDMARTINKLVLDLEEVRRYLDFEWKFNEVEFQTQKNSLCKKYPNVGAIKEASFESNSEIDSEERRPQTTSITVPSADDSFVQKKTCINETERNSVALNFNLMLDDVIPISDVDKQGNSHEHQEKQNIENRDQGSLTPTLDIDLPFQFHKRSSARRQSQLFKINSRSTKSHEKSSENSISPKVVVDPVPLNAENNEPIDMELTDILSKHPILVYDPKISEANVNYASDIVDGSDELVNVYHMESVTFGTSQASHDHPSVEQSSNSSETILNEGISSERIKKNLKQKRRPKSMIQNYNMLHPTDISAKLISDEISSAELDVNNQLPLHESLKSPSPRNVCHRKECIPFIFSPSDTEIGDTPKTSNSCKKKTSHCKNRSTVLFIPKPLVEKSPKSVTPPKSLKSRVDPPLCAESLTEETSNDTGSNNLTVELEQQKLTPDISFSTNGGKEENAEVLLPRKGRLSKRKKLSKRKTPTKLSHTFNVKKRKDFDNSVKRKSTTGSSPCSFLDQVFESPPNKNIPKSPDTVKSSVSISKISLDQTFNNVLETTSTNSLQDKYLSPVEQALVTSKLLDSNFETPVVKRVSFAPTDTVCRFKRMSLSKNIATVTKVRRASKSFTEAEIIEDGLVQSLETNNSLSKDREQNGGILSKEIDEGTPVFDIEDDTELYKFSLPLNFLCLNNNKQPSSKEGILSGLLKSWNNSNDKIESNKKKSDSIKEKSMRTKTFSLDKRKNIYTAQNAKHSPVKNSQRHKFASSASPVPTSVSKVVLAADQPLQQLETNNNPKEKKQVNDTPAGMEKRTQMFEAEDETELYTVSFAAEFQCPNNIPLSSEGGVGQLANKQNTRDSTQDKVLEKQHHKVESNKKECDLIKVKSVKSSKAISFDKRKRKSAAQSVKYTQVTISPRQKYKSSRPPVPASASEVEITQDQPLQQLKANGSPSEKKEQNNISAGMKKKDIFNIEDETELYTFSFLGKFQCPSNNIPFSSEQNILNNQSPDKQNICDNERGKTRLNKKETSDLIKVKTGKTGAFSLDDRKENLSPKNDEFLQVPLSSKQSLKGLTSLEVNNKKSKTAVIDDLLICKSTESKKSLLPAAPAMCSIPKNSNKLEKISLTNVKSRYSNEGSGRFSRRPSKPVSYKEPNLHKKLRRE